MRSLKSVQTLSSPRVLVAALAVAVTSLLLTAPVARAGDVDLSFSVGVPIVYSAYGDHGYLVISTGSWGAGYGHYYGTPHFRYGIPQHHAIRSHRPYGKRHIYYGKHYRPYGNDHRSFVNHRGHGKGGRFYGNHRSHGGHRHQQIDRYQRRNFRGHRR
ncbi:MAG: hypothetical protein C0617_14330 [Desulfuromonas sp.]|uniref:hypothetical protein n=1 Tax=Desulfuromonas sp. TaxID=892 RepID=UPI000CA9B874|nr:hypothetical protein [Desulfuromonas sp.]PLX82300.1 MAG: hypothetical protein C0617_14330 [Desulfuromonas sp.]